MSFVVIFMAFLMGIAGGFLAMHFISIKQEYITKTQLDEGLEAIEREIADRADEHFKFLKDTITDQNSLLDRMDKRMGDHYLWSLGVWNDFANLKDTIRHPIPESLQDIARSEVSLNEDDDEVLPMGPVDKVFKDPTEGIKAAVKMATGVDISEEPKTKKCEFVQPEIQVVDVGDKVDIPESVSKKLRKKKGKK